MKSNFTELDIMYMHSFCDSKRNLCSECSRCPMHTLTRESVNDGVSAIIFITEGRTTYADSN